MRILTLFLISTVLLIAGCETPNQSSYANHPAFNQRQGHGRRPDGRIVDAPEAKIGHKLYFRAAKLLEANGELSKAAAQYRLAIAEKPNYVEAHNQLGILLGYLGQHEGAVSHLERAIKLRPEMAALRNNLGFEYLLNSEWATAERQFRHALTLDPKSGRAAMNLGMSLAAQKDYDSGLNLFRTVVPEADAYYNIALAFQAHR